MMCQLLGYVFLSQTFHLKEIEENVNVRHQTETVPIRMGKTAKRESGKECAKLLPADLEEFQKRNLSTQLSQVLNDPWLVL